MNRARFESWHQDTLGAPAGDKEWTKADKDEDGFVTDKERDDFEACCRQAPGGMIEINLPSGGAAEEEDEEDEPEEEAASGGLGSLFGSAASLFGLGGGAADEPPPPPPPVKIEVYSAPGCKYCNELKEKITALGLTYETLQLGTDDQWGKMQQRSMGCCSKDVLSVGKPQDVLVLMPQLFVDGKWSGSNRSPQLTAILEAALAKAAANAPPKSAKSPPPPLPPSSKGSGRSKGGKGKGAGGRSHKSIPALGDDVEVSMKSMNLWHEPILLGLFWTEFGRFAGRHQRVETCLCACCRLERR